MSCFGVQTEEELFGDLVEEWGHCEGSQGVIITPGRLLVVVNEDKSE